MRAKRRRWLRWGVTLALLGALALWMTRPQWHGVPVTVVVARSGAVAQTVVSSGRVLAPAELRLGSVIVGTAVAVAVREGDRVVPGQVLVALADAEARAAVARAEAAAAGVAAQRRALEAKLAPTAREALRQARANLDQAEREAARDRELVAKGARTLAEGERTATTLAVAQSQLRQAQLDARATAPDGADVAALDASEAEARAAVDAARARLDQTRVVAPAAGVVLTRTVEPGDVVQPGAPLLVVAADGPQRLVIEPDEKNLSVLALGQPALVSADAYPDHRFAARVGWIAPAVDRRRGTIEVRLDVPTAEPLLKPDMTVSVEIEVAHADDALTLPRSAVRDLASDTPWVLVVDGSRAARRELALGLRGDQIVEVRSGLATGDRVIPPANGGPAAGAKVRVDDSAGGG